MFAWTAFFYRMKGTKNLAHCCSFTDPKRTGPDPFGIDHSENGDPLTAFQACRYEIVTLVSQFREVVSGSILTGRVHDWISIVQIGDSPLATHCSRRNRTPGSRENFGGKWSHPFQYFRRIIEDKLQVHVYFKRKHLSNSYQSSDYSTFGLMGISNIFNSVANFWHFSLQYEEKLSFASNQWC